MPRLAGTFYTELGGGIGSGSTHQQVTQRLNWFAIYLDDERVLVRALNADGLPTTVSNVVPARDFCSQYTLDQELFGSTILPLLRQLREKMGKGDGDADGLGREEQQVLSALLFSSEHLPGLSKEERRERSLGMLSNLPENGEIIAEHRTKVNVESIAARKDGQYEEAIDLYGSLMRVNPEDDHVFFNVARVHFERKDMIACRKYLHLALESNPEFKEARKFLEYLDQKAPLENPEVRRHLRFRFHSPQACVLVVGGAEIESEILDLSAAGVRFSSDTGKRAGLEMGLEVTIRGRSELVEPLVRDEPARIVWVSGKLYGAAFGNSLDTGAPEFKRIVAYAELT